LKPSQSLELRHEVDPPTFNTSFEDADAGKGAIAASEGCRFTVAAQPVRRAKVITKTAERLCIFDPLSK
jgi:hypothetical protein